MNSKEAVKEAFKRIKALPKDELMEKLEEHSKGDLAQELLKIGFFETEDFKPGEEIVDRPGRTL